MAYEIWHEVTLSLGAALALFGFFRGQEHHKDREFREVGMRLADGSSPLMRAAAAAELPSFFRYRRAMVLGRPYKDQCLVLVLAGLKVEKEEHFVRQALINALHCIIQDGSWPAGVHPDLRDAQLQALRMWGVAFDGFDLSCSTLMESDLGNASFVGSKLWRADLSKARLSDADFTDAELWDADFSNANLENARLVTEHVNSQTRFHGSNQNGMLVSQNVVKQCPGIDRDAVRSPN